MEPQICMCDCIAGLQFIFSKHASKEGCPDTLTKDELKDLFKSEARGGGASMPDEVIEGIFKGMDLDKNNKIDFTEYMVFVTQLAIAADKMKGCQGEQKKS